MKKLATVLALSLAVVGCEKSNGSKLDSLATTSDSDAPAKKRPNATPIGTGTIEERVARLEQSQADNAEALDFLNKVYAQNKQQMEAQEAREPDPNAMFAVDVAPNVKIGMSEGPATAPVTIIKVFDFACPYCEQVNETMHELVKDNGGKVRVIYKNLVVHPDTALAGHMASCAAAKQGKYREFKDAFWKNAFGGYKASGGKDKTPMGAENILKFSAELGLNTTQLKADMEGKDCQTFIQGDMQELQKFRVNSTPTFYVNGKHVGGAVGKEDFQRMIDQQLALVQKSGVSGADYYEKVVMAKGEKQFKSKKGGGGGPEQGGGGDGHDGH
ncbi:MAG: thioredoxin domain-containing protein [Kofleriaceae bacterium]